MNYFKGRGISFIVWISLIWLLSFNICWARSHLPAPTPDPVPRFDVYFKHRLDLSGAGEHRNGSRFFPSPGDYDELVRFDDYVRTLRPVRSYAEAEKYLEELREIAVKFISFDIFERERTAREKPNMVLKPRYVPNQVWIYFIGMYCNHLVRQTNVEQRPAMQELVREHIQNFRNWYVRALNLPVTDTNVKIMDNLLSNIKLLVTAQSVIEDANRRMSPIRIYLETWTKTYGVSNIEKIDRRLGLLFMSLGTKGDVKKLEEAFETLVKIKVTSENGSGLGIEKLSEFALYRYPVPFQEWIVLTLDRFFKLFPVLGSRLMDFPIKKYVDEVSLYPQRAGLKKLTSLIELDHLFIQGFDRFTAGHTESERYDIFNSLRRTQIQIYLPDPFAAFKGLSERVEIKDLITFFRFFNLTADQEAQEDVAKYFGPFTRNPESRQKLSSDQNALEDLKSFGLVVREDEFVEPVLKAAFNKNLFATNPDLEPKWVMAITALEKFSGNHYYKPLCSNLLSSDTLGK